MPRKIVLCILYFLLMVAEAVPVLASQRVALVIGNGAYADSPLANPVNDAREMGRVLENVGFQTTVLTNVGKREMEDAIRAFGSSLKTGTTGLFYFAGHGMQVDGANYLVPVGAAVRSENDVRYEGVDASRVLAEMESAKNGVNIVILDACRNNPFERSFRSGTRGLARMDAPGGSFIAYATAPGKVAADGTGSNGVFTAAILKHIQTPGMGLDDLFRSVRVDVMEQTKGEQIPWQSSSMIEVFRFQETKDWAKDLDAKSAEYEQLKELMGQQAAEDKKRAAEEAEYKARIARLDVEVAAMQKRLGSSAARKDDSLQAMLAMVQQKEAEEAKLVELRKAREAEELKRKIEMTRIRHAQRMQRMEAMKADIDAYRQIVESKYGATMGDAAWAALVAKYPEQSKDIEKGDTESLLWGRRWIDPVIGAEFVWIPGGCFMMGSDTGSFDEKPVHEVCLDGFWMARYEVTQKQWGTLMGRNPSRFLDESRPVERVDFKSVRSFIRRLNEKGNAKYNLPTEAQWEYAARGGTYTQYWWGDEVGEGNANCKGCGGDSNGKFTLPVGTFKPNPFGLYDISGNVSEWCLDTHDYHAYTKHSRDNPLIIDKTCDAQVTRGGAYYNSPTLLGSARRNREYDNAVADGRGFRLIRTE